MVNERNCSVSAKANAASILAITSAKLFPSPHTVKGRVLGAFLKGDGLTHLDCWRLFGSSRLSSHVHKLRTECGWDIKTVNVVTTTRDANRKASIALYSLALEDIQHAGELGQHYAAETARINAERRAG